jgi:hypothetical protein
MRSEPAVVGSPRSGTSILTWCLGQYPNLLPVPESNWMGDFAVNVAVACQIDAARGDYSILSAMDIRDDEMFAALGESINHLIIQHRTDLERKRETRSAALKLDAVGWKQPAQQQNLKHVGLVGRRSILCISAVCESFPRALYSSIYFAMFRRSCARWLTSIA